MDVRLVEQRQTEVARYHWTQTFPAKSTVHLRHEYSPVTGAQLVPTNVFAAGHKVTADEKYAVEDAASLCVSPGAERAFGASKTRIVALEWVDFILTTANSWKRPIEDFTLIVERGDPKEVVSFCWDGPVTKVMRTAFRPTQRTLCLRRNCGLDFTSQGSRVVRTMRKGCVLGAKPRI